MPSCRERAYEHPVPSIEINENRVYLDTDMKNVQFLGVIFRDSKGFASNTRKGCFNMCFSNAMSYSTPSVINSGAFFVVVKDYVELLSGVS